MPHLRILPLVTVLCLLVGCASAAPADDRAHTVDVTLVTANVQNFFDAFDDPYTWDNVMWPKRKEESIALGKVLQQTDADFIGVQEIENEGILVRFRGWNLAGRGFDYHYCAQSLGSRGINNAFLSKVPPRPITVHKYERFGPDGDVAQTAGKTYTFARHPVEARLHPAADVELTVFVLHLKSKRTVDDADPQSAAWRLAEAKRIRALIDARLAADPEALIVVMGDLNDTPASPPIRALLADSAAGKPALVDPHRDIPDDKDDTYLKKPYRDRVDYVLLSPALARHVKDGSAKIYNEGETGSDHAPVGVTLTLPTAHADAEVGWPSGEPERELQTYFKDGDPEKPADAE